MACFEKTPSGIGIEKPIYRQSPVERAFELAAGGRVQNVKELRRLLAQEGFDTMDLEGPTLSRQLALKIKAAKA